MKKIIFSVLLLVAVGFGFYFISRFQAKDEVNGDNSAANSESELPQVEGLAVEMLNEGTGNGAKGGDRLKVNYIGTLEDGTVFDSNTDRGNPFEFTLGAGNVISGWELGLVGMKIGEKRKLTISPELAYGNRQVSVIPPNSTLIFEVDLLGINNSLLLP